MFKKNYSILVTAFLLLITSCSQSLSSSLDSNEAFTRAFDRDSQDGIEKHYPSELTEDEKKLANELDFDQKVLSLVKSKTGSSFVAVEMAMIGKWKEAGAEDSNKFESPWSNQKNIDNLAKVKRDYPELVPAVDAQMKRLADLSYHDELGSVASGISDSKMREEDMQYSAKLSEFSPYIMQDLEQSGVPQRGYYFGIRKPDKTKLSYKQMYMKLKDKYAGVKLDERYKPVKGVLVSMPASDQYTDEIVEELQGMLASSGYSIFGTGENRVVKTFDSEAEAIKHCGPGSTKSYGKAHKYVRKFDPAKFDPDDRTARSSEFWVPPGVTVKKLAPDKWEFTTPACFTVESSQVRAVLVKGVDPVRFVELVGSSGPNYSVTNQQVKEKLEHWDSAYGIQVLSARADSVHFKVKNLPDNLDHFLTEVFLICPDAVELSPDMISSAMAMRAFAQDFKEDRSIVLWWD